MTDLDLEYGSDQDVSENHAKLVEAVSKLDKGQRVKKPQRSEPSLEVSEFHLVKSGISDKDAVRVDDLAKSLGGKGHHEQISKKFKATKQKAKVLPKPLEKPAADRLRRIVGFENTKKELRAWNGVVAKNRSAEQLRFPLNQSSMRWEPTDQFVKRFTLQSELEKELAALEPPKPVEKEKPDEFPLTLAEILEKRKETARFRAQQSYREAKAYRQNKIKSKKFHRIQRKERIKQQMKEFEELQKTDPEAALEKLEQLDKTRAQERMTLRHKSTGQWAKNKQVRAKYDKESRQVLAQQLSISRTLTQKVRSNEDSDEDDEAANEVLKPLPGDKDNPWVNGTKTSSEIDNFVSGYRKYWDEKNKALQEKKNAANGDDSGKPESNKKRNRKMSAAQKARAAMNPVESVEIIPQNGSNESNNSKSLKGNKTTEALVTEVDNEAKENQSNGVINEKSIKANKQSKKAKTPNAILNENAETEMTDELQVVPKKCKPKKAAKAKKTGTSEWFVEPLVNGESEETLNAKKSLDIDELFETMEDKLINRIDTKLKSVKRKLATSTAANKKSKPADDEEESDKEYTTDLTFKKRILRPDLDEEMDEGIGISGNQAISKKSSLQDDLKLAKDLEAANVTSEKKISEIDPNKFVKVVPKYLKTQIPDIVTGGDEALDDNESDEEQHNIISEAFADDDVVQEFKKEKDEEVKNSQPQDLDLRLPGWGTWGGKDIARSNRKKRRFIMKFPKDVKRRDENKGDVIIIEESDPKIKKHQVSELPFPFTSVKDFEASIRAPIGRTFVPENAHKNLIKPAVKTKMGQIIEPMDVDALVSKNPKSKKRTKGLKKGKKTEEKITI